MPTEAESILYAHMRAAEDEVESLRASLDRVVEERDRYAEALAEVVAVTPGPNDKPDPIQSPDYYCGWMAEQELGQIARAALRSGEGGTA